MKQWIALFSLSLIFTSAAFAQDGNGSQYQYQAPANQFDLTPALEFQGVNTKFKGGSTSSLKQTTVTIDAMGEYGLNDMFSVGLILAAAAEGDDNGTSGVRNTHSTGFLDPDLFVNGRLQLGPGSFRFGTHLTVALEKKHLYSDGNSNQSSGGIHMSPFVGYEVEINRNIFGARFIYDFSLMHNKLDLQGLSGTEKGGEVFTSALFYEYHLTRVIIGGAFELTNQASARSEMSDGSVTDSLSQSSWRIKGYAPVRLSSRATILPSIAYGQAAAFDSTNTDSVSTWELNVPIRITF